MIANTQQTAATKSSYLKDFKVAIVSESHAELIRMQRLFQKTSYRHFLIVPFQFTSGCLSSLLEFKPDVVFVDYDLGLLTGASLVEQTTAFIPRADFILVGDANEEAVIDSLRAGASDYLRKEECTCENIEKCMRRVVKKKIAERELIRSEMKFRAIFDKSLDVLMIVDYRSGLILQANEASYSILGYKPYQLQGENFTKLFPAQPRISCAKFLAGIRTNGSVIESQVFLKSDATSVHMDVTATVVPYGTDKAILMTLRDVSFRRAGEIHDERLRADLEKRVKDRTSQVERSNRKLRMEIFERKRMEGHLLHNRSRLEAAERIGKMGHLEYDVAQKSFVISSELARLFARDPKEISSPMLSFIELSGEEVSAILMGKIAEIVEKGKTETIEYWTTLPDGSRACHRVLFNALKNGVGTISKVLGVIQEITEQKLAAENLQTALNREKELNQLTNVFVSMVSHELRTPLAVIQSSIDLFKEVDLTAEEKEQCLASIESSLSRMTGIMEKVLLIGRMESRQIIFNPGKTDLAAICEHVAGDLELVGYDPKRIHFEFKNVPKDLYLDELFMTHVIQNLLSNAFKYSEKDKPIFLRTRMDGSSLEVVIEDQGMGIPQDEQHKLFQIFYRCSNAFRISGSGVGMVVVKRCVEAHNGTIHFTSVEGKGTTFCLRFPNVLTAPKSNSTT